MRQYIIHVKKTWPHLFCTLMGEQDRVGVHGKVWPWPAARSAWPSKAFTLIDRAWALAWPPTAFTFIDRAWAGPPSETFTFIDRA